MRGTRWGCISTSQSSEALKHLNHLANSTIRSPGQLAVTWTEKGEMGIDASHETVIGTLTFETHGSKGTPIAFKTERSQLVDKQGVRIAAKWSGGASFAR